MALEFESSDDVANDAPFLEKPGVYHFAVMHAVENAVWRGGDKKGQLRGGFEIEAVVLAGSEAKKTISLFFRNPDLSHKDGGKFCRKVQTRALEAIAVLDPSNRGKAVSVVLEGADGQPCPVQGRQFIAKLVSGTDKEGKPTKFLDLAGANIWHVDDPEAEQCERSQAHLAASVYPAKYRRDPKSFGGANGPAGNGQTKPPASTTPPTPPVAPPTAPAAANVSQGVSLEEI